VRIQIFHRFSFFTSYVFVFPQLSASMTHLKSGLRISELYLALL